MFTQVRKVHNDKAIYFTWFGYMFLPKEQNFDYSIGSHLYFSKLFILYLILNIDKFPFSKLVRNNDKCSNLIGGNVKNVIP